MITEPTEKLLRVLEDLATELDDTKGRISAAWAADRIGEIAQDFREAHGDGE